MAEQQKKNDEKVGYTVLNRLEEITIHTEGYVEPGYDSKYDVIATGNWNSVDRYNHEKRERVFVSDLPKRIGNLFEKLGIEVEWSDEWEACYDCGKLVRTQPDSYGWTPEFTYDDNGLYCKECKSEEQEDDEDDDDDIQDIER